MIPRPVPRLTGALELAAYRRLKAAILDAYGPIRDDGLGTLVLPPVEDSDDHVDRQTFIHGAKEAHDER